MFSNDNTFCCQNDEEKCLMSCCFPIYIISNFLSIILYALRLLLYIFIILPLSSIYEYTILPCGRIFRKCFINNNNITVIESVEINNNNGELKNYPNVVIGIPVMNNNN